MCIESPAKFRKQAKALKVVLMARLDRRILKQRTLALIQQDRAARS